MGVKTHKLRSSLTILGVVIGVGAVISLMSIGRGTQANIVSSVQGLGSNLLFISPGSTTVGGVRGGTGSASTLSMDDTIQSLRKCSISFLLPLLTAPAHR
jgi:putative ABC transport system permease protein